MKFVGRAFLALSICLLAVEVRAFTLIVDVDAWLVSERMPAQVDAAIMHQKNTGLINAKAEQNSNGSLAGFFSYSDTLMYGPGITWSEHVFKAQDQTTFKFKLVTFSFSTMWYALGNNQHGLFLRGDLGITATHASTNNAELKNEFPDNQDRWHFGGTPIGVSLGAGYSYMFNSWFGMDLHSKYHRTGSEYGTTEWTDVGFGLRFSF